MISEKKFAVSPAKLRQTLEQLGPTFVKIGQYLALRPDLIPQQHCDELLKLVDSAKFFPNETALRILTEDLGRDVQDCFARFEVQPVAAASLAQVYRAETHDGHVVAVKVQREGIRESVRKDIARARLVGPLIELFGLIPGISVREALRELERWMTDELDFEQERRNMKQMRALLRDDSSVKIPRVFDGLSGKRVITMEYLAGVPFSRLLRLAHEERWREISELGLEPDTLAENLLRTCLEQAFRHETFHADTHPGNIIALPGNVIGFVDFGLVETLEFDLRRGVRRFVAGAYSDDVDGMLDGLAELMIPEHNADPQSFRQEFAREHQVWSQHKRADTPSSGGDSPLGNYMIGVMRAARRCHMRLPSSLLSMYRSLLTAETVAHQLGGRDDLLSVGRGFFVGLQVERLAHQLRPGQVQQALIPYLEFLEEPPDKYLGLLSDIAEGRFVLRVESSESAASRRSGAYRARLIALAILFVGISMLVSPSRDVWLAGRVPLTYVLWGLLAVVLIWLIVLWRRVD